MAAASPHPNIEMIGPSMISPLDFLSALPNELIAQILDTVDRADLLALRLVSKLIHGSSINRFATEFFEDVPVIMSRRSLNALVDIAAHEVFGPYVKSITLSSVQICNKLRAVSEHFSVDHFDMWHAHHGRLVGSGTALQLLTQALQSVQNHGNGIRFGLDDKECSSANCIGTRYVDFCKIRRGSTLDVMFRAATNSRCNVQALNFHMENERISIEDLGQSALEYVCSDLLAIDFMDHRVPGMSPFRPIMKMLELATNVQNMNLAFGLDNWRDYHWTYVGPWQYFMRCAEAISTPCLSTLRLANLAAREEDCLGLLAKSHMSLRSLKLKDCLLRHGGCWLRVLTWIRDKLSLETLEIHGMYMYEEDLDKPERVMENNEKWRLEGADQVREGLNEIIRLFEEMEATSDLDQGGLVL